MDRFGVMAGAALDPNAAEWGLVGLRRSSCFRTPRRSHTADAVASFLDRYGIDYIYADSRHPNTLAPDAVPIAESGGYQLLEVP